MKKLLTLIFITGANLCLAQQAFYDVTASDGNGVRFWQNDAFKIHMGNSAEYHYGPVWDYSIKTNMSFTAGRGWTWGLPGATPIAALSNVGTMQIAGTFQSANITAMGAQSIEETVLNASNFSDQDFNVRISARGAATKRTIMGPSTAGRFSFGVGVGNSNEYLTILNGGYVGIGTTSPNQKLEVDGSVLFNAENAAFGFDAQPNARLGIIKKFGSYPTISSSSGAPIVFGQTNQPDIYTNISGATLTERMRIDANGNVGIGTSNPGSYKLAIEGKIGAREVNVIGTNPWPDYVFEKNYKLPSLEEIKNYIDQNQHLPEVPSAKEVEKNGVNLGEMNALLLKKIEELTLYVIEANKKMEGQQSKLEEATRKIENQQQQIEELRLTVKKN